MNLLTRSTVGLMCVFLVGSCATDTPSGLIARFDNTGTDYGSISLNGSADSTTFTLHLYALKPEIEYIIRLYGGTCTQPGSSSTIVTRITADHKGKARGSGTLLYRESEHMSFDVFLADTHIVVLEADMFQDCAPVTKHQ